MVRVSGWAGGQWEGPTYTSKQLQGISGAGFGASHWLTQWLAQEKKGGLAVEEVRIMSP